GRRPPTPAGSPLGSPYAAGTHGRTVAGTGDHPDDHRVTAGNGAGGHSGDPGSRGIRPADAVEPRALEPGPARAARHRGHGRRPRHRGRHVPGRAGAAPRPALRTPQVRPPKRRPRPATTSTGAGSRMAWGASSAASPLAGSVTGGAGAGAAAAAAAVGVPG